MLCHNDQGTLMEIQKTFSHQDNSLMIHDGRSLQMYDDVIEGSQIEETPLTQHQAPMQLMWFTSRFLLQESCSKPTLKAPLRRSHMTGFCWFSSFKLDVTPLKAVWSSSSDCKLRICCLQSQRKHGQPIQLSQFPSRFTRCMSTCMDHMISASQLPAAMYDGCATGSTSCGCLSL